MTGSPLPLAAGACPDENVLALLGEGALEDAPRAALEAHLEACQRCAQLITELARLPGARELPERYRALRQLGAGAMGIVWEAEDTQLGRRVAVKLIAPARADDPALRARFLREARALAQLHHPNVIAVHDVGEHVDNLYLTLELVPGTTARAWLAAAPRSITDILGLWGQVAAGLAAIHRAGLIHRDIKPDNVLVDEVGHARIADLGLATQPDAVRAALTSAGAVIGTPLYMAPEQLAGEPATPRSDQFSLCASIWEALTGERPFAGSTVAALAVAMTRPLALPRSDRVPRHYFAILARALDPEPAKRWPSIDALARELAATSTGSRRRRKRLPAAAIAGLGVALGAWAVWRAPAMQRTSDPPVRAAAIAVAPGSNALTGTLECTLAYETLVPFANRHNVTFAEPLAAIYDRGVLAGNGDHRLRAVGNPKPIANLSLNIDVEEIQTGAHVAYIVLPPPQKRDGDYLFESGAKIAPTVIDGHTYDYVRVYCEFHP